MPVRKIEFFPNKFYHIYNRGSEKKIIFKNQDDYFYFLRQIKKYKKQFDIKVVVYNLMPNHFHFILKEPEYQSTPGVLEPEAGPPRRGPASNGSISKFMHKLQTAYAMYFNQKYQVSGHVFQGRFKSILVDREAYLNFLSCYIHVNAQEAGLVDKAEDWLYSSLLDYLGLRAGTIPDKDCLLLDMDYKILFEDYLEYKEERDGMIKRYIDF